MSSKNNQILSESAFCTNGMPNLDMLTRIAEYFDVPIDFLREFTGLSYQVMFTGIE